MSRRQREVDRNGVEVQCVKVVLFYFVNIVLVSRYFIFVKQTSK